MSTLAAFIAGVVVGIVFLVVMSAISIGHDSEDLHQ